MGSRLFVLSTSSNSPNYSYNKSQEWVCTVTAHNSLKMATTGLADSANTRFDATTPPKPSSLDPKLCVQLLVDLHPQVQELRTKGNFDLEGVLAFQRAANYL